MREPRARNAKPTDSQLDPVVADSSSCDSHDWPTVASEGSRTLIPRAVRARRPYVPTLGVPPTSPSRRHRDAVVLV